MWWELDGDREGELVEGDGGQAPRRAHRSVDRPDEPPRRRPDAHPDVDPDADPTPTNPPNPGECTAAAWSASAVYIGGNTVSYGGNEYRAKWWTQNNVPGTADVWALVGACGVNPTTPPTTPTRPPRPAAAAWSATTVYNGGDQVTYSGSVYKAKWWTQNNIPGADQWGPWEKQ